MGKQIIKQPDGLYAIWSSNTDTFTMIDCDPESIIRIWSEAERARIETHVRWVVRELEKGGRPYYQFTMDWNEAIARHLEVHGEPFDLEKVRAEPDDDDR